MSTSATAQSPAGAPPRYKRSIKNYLLDTRFQLKYTGMIIVVALAISAFMGGFLLRTSSAVVKQSEAIVQESKKVSDVVKMSIKDDPIYGADPELAKAFSAASGASDQEIVRQQEQLVQGQRRMMMAIVGGLTAMVILIGLLGIYFTHKVVGPIYKMKLLLRQVGDGKLNFQGKLRKGDELQDFFETFQQMVDKLKARQKTEVEELEAAIDAAKESGASEEAVAKIVGVRDAMKRALDV